MSERKSVIYKTGLAVSLATFLISNAQANPFQAEQLKTGYGNSDSSTAQSTDGPVVASDSDTVGDLTPAPNSDAIVIPETPDDSAAQPQEKTDKATDGQCGMSGTGH